MTEIALKWLNDLLKANGWIKFAIACASGVFLYRGWFLNAPTWASAVAGAVFLVSSFLSLASILEYRWSACSARLYLIGDFIDERKWTKRLCALPVEARTLLAVLEEDGKWSLYYHPRTLGIAALRDIGVLKVDLVSADGERWGRYGITDAYRRAYQRSPTKFRKLLKYSHHEAAPVRDVMRKARWEATGRI